MRKTIGGNLRALRRARRLTQSEIAKRMSLPQPTYSGYETGLREANYDAINKIAQFHKVSINSLLGMEGEFKTVDEVLKKYEDF